MKAIYKLLAISLCVFSLTACSDFLEEDPRGQLLSTAAFGQAGDLDGAIHALNFQVKYSTHYNSYYAQSMMGDDLTSITAKNTLWDQYMVTDADGCNYDYTWPRYWTIIKAANYIINGVERTPDVTEADIDRALGFAHFWRGYYYFFLVRMWGALPMNLDNIVDLSKPLTGEEEIYEQIVEDLKIAEEKLPKNYTTSPYASNGKNILANKAAAQATLAQVYLTMAGWPLNKGTEYYNLAAEEAKKVIDDCENGTYYYALYEDYADLHSKKCNWNNQEAILAMYCDMNYGEGNGSQCSRAVCDLPTETGGYANTRCTLKFWKDFPSGPRKKATYGDVYYHNSDRKVVPWFYANANSQNPYTLKTASCDADVEYDQTKSWSAQSSKWGNQNRIFIKLSDVYLTYAEAVGRSGQTNAKACELVNIVRNRADGQGVSATRADGSDNIYSSNMTAAQLAEAAYDEHGWEVACYHYALSCRYFDMRRMHRVGDYFAYRQQNPTIEVGELWLAENPDKAGMVTPPVNLKEPVEMVGTWSDSRLYIPYPAYDALLNENLKREGLE